MRWLIDTDVFIEGERGARAFIPWLAQAGGVATADVVRGEFLLGVNRHHQCHRAQLLRLSAEVRRA